MKKKFVTLAVTCVMAMMLTACGSADNGAVPTPTTAEKPTEVPAATATPIAEPTSTPTPEPTATSTPTPEPTATPVPEVTDTYVKGTVTENGFESEWLNLRFTTQNDVTMLTQDELDAVMEQSMNLVHGENAEAILDYTSITTVTEMMAKYTNGANVVIQVEKLPRAYSDLTEEEYLSIVINNLRNSAASPEVDTDETFYTVEIGGETYVGISAASDYGTGQLICQEFLIRKRENRMISIVATCTEYTMEYARNLLSCFGSYDSEPIILPEPTPIPDTYVMGTLTENSFASEWIDLRFTATENVDMLTREEMAGLSEAGAGLMFGEDAESRVEAAKQTLVFEMMAKHKEGSNTLVQVEILPEGYEEMMEEAYLALLMIDLDNAANIEYVYDDTLYAVEIGGETYIGFSAAGDYGTGEYLYQEYMVRKKEGRMITVILTYEKDTIANAQYLFSLYSSYDSVPVVEPTETPEPTEAPAVEPADSKAGIITDTGYENAWAGFRYILPEGARIVPEEMYDGTILYVEWSEYGIPVVQIVKEELEEPMTEEEFFGELVANFDSTYIYDGTLYTVELGGQEFIYMAVAVNRGDDVYIYQDFCVQAREECIIAVVFTYMDGFETEINAMINGFSPY